MDRLQKKCLIASLVTHVFLLLLVVMGAAFFVPSRKSSELPLFRVVPRKFIDDALSGGGGNPKIAPSVAQQMGETLVPQPPTPQPVVQPLAPKPQKPVEPPPVKKAEPITPAKKPTPRPKDTAKKPTVTTPSKPAPLDLKPTVRKSTDLAKQQREAEARKVAETGKQLARELSKARESLREGFQSGTVVDYGGPGGEAYVNYAQWVKTVYEEAWDVPSDLMDEDSAAKVTVTIARSGHVMSARIERRSGNSTLDKSVQRALDKVKFVEKFPEGSKEEQRTFTINFNLKAKRLTG
jgi:protein TonB